MPFSLNISFKNQMPVPRRQLLPQRGTYLLVGLPSWKPGSRDIIHSRGKTEDMPPHDDGFRQPSWTLL